MLLIFGHFNCSFYLLTFLTYTVTSINSGRCICTFGGSAASAVKSVLNVLKTAAVQMGAMKQTGTGAVR